MFFRGHLDSIYGCHSRISRRPLQLTTMLWSSDQSTCIPSTASSLRVATWWPPSFWRMLLCCVTTLMSTTPRSQGSPRYRGNTQYIFLILRVCHSEYQHMIFELLHGGLLSLALEHLQLYVHCTCIVHYCVYTYLFTSAYVMVRRKLLLEARVIVEFTTTVHV